MLRYRRGFQNFALLSKIYQKLYSKRSVSRSCINPCLSHIYLPPLEALRIIRTGLITVCSRPDMSTDIQPLLTQSQSKKRIEREKAISEINHTLQNSVSADSLTAEISSFISDTLNSDLGSMSWEDTHGVLLLIEMLAQLGKISSGLVELYLAKYNTLILSREVAVRNETAKLLEVLSKVFGYECFSKLQDTVLSQAEHYNSISTSSKDSQSVNFSFIPKHTNAEELNEALTWKYLESYLESIRYVAKGCNESVKGPSEFDVFVTPRLIELMQSTSRHPNRFVRESTFNIISLLVQKSSVVDSAESNTLRVCMQWREALVGCLSLGLSDDWSQVRMSGCIACRHFFGNLPTQDWAVLFPILLPPLCLNRYYEATGIQTYSLETWRLLTAGEGQALVETHLESILHFYLSQSASENHAARTAVLQCLGELGRKIHPDLIKPYQQEIAACVIRTLKDPCWPVREATCYCITAMVPLFPSVYLPLINELLPALLEVLGDFIPAARQSAAFALADIVKVYKDKVLGDIFREIKERVLLVREQKEVPVYDDAFVHPAFYGIMSSDIPVVPGEKENPTTVNSLSQPWMRTDGCVYLIAELSQNAIAHKEIIEVLQLLAEVSKFKHYAQHIQLFETICRALPVIAKGIGKKDFKIYFSLFIDMLFYSLNHANLATSRAARESLSDIIQVLGRGIVRYRIEDYDPLLIPKFDEFCTSIQ